MDFGILLAEGASTAQMLGDIVTADMLGGITSQIMSVLPVVVPVGITLMAIRKGINFLFGSLARA